MALILLMAVATIGCIGLLANKLTDVINISDEIVSTQVTEEENIRTVQEFTYINSQVYTHVMTTNAVTMQEMQTEIEAEIAKWMPRWKNSKFIKEGDLRQAIRRCGNRI